MKKLFILSCSVMIIMATSVCAFALTLNFASSSELPTFRVASSSPTLNEMNESRFNSKYATLSAQGWPVSKKSYVLYGAEYYVIQLVSDVTIWVNGSYYGDMSAPKWLGDANGVYAYKVIDEEETVTPPSVDMSSTNSILADIYEQFYSYSYAQNKLLYSIDKELMLTSDYLVSVLNDYFYPLVYNIDSHTENIDNYVGAIGQTLTLRLREIVYSIQNIEEDTAAIRTLLENGIPVTGVEIGDVTVSTDLTNVEGYIDNVEKILNSIFYSLNNAQGRPYLPSIVTYVDGLETTLSSILTELQNDTSTGGATDLTNVEGYIDQLESKLDAVNSNLRIGQVPAVSTINSGIATTNKRLNDIYTRLGDIEDAVIDAGNIDIDITTDNDAFNIFYVEKTDGTSESVGVVTKDAAKVVGEFLSVFYRLIFADGLENADIIHDFEDVYTVTDSGVSVW